MAPLRNGLHLSCRTWLRQADLSPGNRGQQAADERNPDDQFCKGSPKESIAGGANYPR